MLSGMLMVRGEICGCTGFTGDSGASRFTFLPLDRAVNVILMLVLGNLKVHLEEENRVSLTQMPRRTRRDSWDSQRSWRRNLLGGDEEPAQCCCLSGTRKGHITEKPLQVETLISSHIPEHPSC